MVDTLVWFALGLAALVAGAEALVRGAARLAATAGVSPLVVGLTVVAFGTSSPELAVVLKSSLQGNSGLSVGNVVGSNICNVLLILGLAAAISPLRVARRLIRLDVPLMIGISFVFFFLSLDQQVSRTDGLLLFVGAPVYTIWLIRRSRRGKHRQDEHTSEQTLNALHPAFSWKALTIDLLHVSAGLALLVYGSDWLVGAAVWMARYLQVSDLLIGLTIVAVGTSLPEVATSLVATLRGQRDLAVGNVVGSNIFNILLVLGFSAMVASDGIEVPSSALAFDFPVMLAVSFACLPIFFYGRYIDRWEGLLFLFYYAAYLVYLILQATESDTLRFVHDSLAYFVLPLTLVTLFGLSRRKQRLVRSGRAPF